MGNESSSVIDEERKKDIKIYCSNRICSWCGVWVYRSEETGWKKCYHEYEFGILKEDTDIHCLAAICGKCQSEGKNYCPIAEGKLYNLTPEQLQKTNEIKSRSWIPKYGDDPRSRNNAK